MAEMFRSHRKHITAAHSQAKARVGCYCYDIGESQKKWRRNLNLRSKIVWSYNLQTLPPGSPCTNAVVWVLVWVGFVVYLQFGKVCVVLGGGHFGGRISFLPGRMGPGNIYLYDESDTIILYGESKVSRVCVDLFLCGKGSCFLCGKGSCSLRDYFGRRCDRVCVCKFQLRAL